MIKNKNAYKTIGEVAKEIGLVDKKNGKTSTHTLRFWEKEFKQLKPKILNGNRRYYDKSNIELLKKIQYLLKNQGMTVNGVKKILNKNDPLKLDENLNDSINVNTIKNKINNISDIIKSLKKLK